MSEETTGTDKKSKVIGKINEIKSNIETFISDVNVNEIKSSINVLVKDAQKDFNKLINKDLDSVKKKLQKEKADIEKKAKVFLEGHKKELNALQAKFDKLVKKAKSESATASPKKTTKKVAKKAPAKKATKKASKKA